VAKADLMMALPFLFSVPTFVETLQSVPSFRFMHTGHTRSQTSTVSERNTFCRRLLLCQAHFCPVLSISCDAQILCQVRARVSVCAGGQSVLMVWRCVGSQEEPGVAAMVLSPRNVGRGPLGQIDAAGGGARVDAMGPQTPRTSPPRPASR
jgi:hypothetical protein